ncbi:hypothetical protein ACWC6I_42465 [Streptomyces sp. NPDC001414]
MTDHQPQADGEPPDQTGSDGPDLFRFKRPTRPEIRAYGSGAVGAVGMTGEVPHTPVVGGALLVLALADFLWEHVRR